ncbi:hypothetical protein [Burkholderia sp. Nafp2/4-1b]|uniref:hypothetical protein n=1 Tax=Burkholderia sp. Nafp2/4-1b TaxID=2116686 RepID=UPI0013CF2032|nr:hypothetical protein [Burkholderia sp. Nafp2/4-1b]
MEWMKRKYSEVNTVLSGTAEGDLQRLYGTYKVVGKSSKANPNISILKLVRSDQGNPVLRFFDKNEKEFEFWSAPQECRGLRAKDGEFSSLTCGNLETLKGVGQFTLSKESKFGLNEIYPKNIEITEKSYHYSSYEGYGRPIIDFSLLRVE